MINPRLALGIGRPDKAVSARQFQVSNPSSHAAAAVHSGAGAGLNDASGSFNNTTNISLGVGGIMVIVLVGLYWWTRNHQG